MFTSVLLIVGALLLVALYIMLSSPKPHNWRELGRYSSLFNSSLKADNYPSTTEVFKTLKDAGIKPCFLSADIHSNNED